MELRRERDRVRLFLEWRESDGEVPVRRLYWLCVDPPEHAWTTTVPSATVEHWLTMAVPADFPGGDRRVWRQTSRYAVVRVRKDPAAIGVNASLMPPTEWSRR